MAAPAENWIQDSPLGPSWAPPPLLRRRGRRRRWLPPEEAGNSVYEGLHAGDEVSLDYVVRTDYLKPQGNKAPIQLTCLHIRGIRTLISEGGR